MIYNFGVMNNGKKLTIVKNDTDYCSALTKERNDNGIYYNFYDNCIKPANISVGDFILCGDSGYRQVVSIFSFNVTKGKTT